MLEDVIAPRRGTLDASGPLARPEDDLEAFAASGRDQPANERSSR